MKHVSKYLLLTIFTLALINCTDNEVEIDPTAGLSKLQEGYALGAGARVELWGKESFFTGYNVITALLYDSVSNKRITNAKIHFEPEMSMMGGMKHACPVENPEEVAVNEAFSGAIEFIMPTSDMGSWKLSVNVHNHQNDKQGEAGFAITVVNPAAARVKSFLTVNNEKIFISYDFPKTMKVGVNDIDVIAYKMAAPYEFIPIDDLTFALTPEMPSMGHGSPNNVNPVSTTNGHYSGKVNFTMTGDWRLNLSISRNGSLLKEVYFDVTQE